MSSTEQATSRRSRRGRIVLVGTHPSWEGERELAKLRDAAGMRTEKVENLFDAIGELARSTASEPIDAMFVSGHVLNGDAARVAQAIRRLDPSVTLVCVSDDGIDAAAFDATIQPPLDARMFRRVLDGEIDDDEAEATGVPQPLTDTTKPRSDTSQSCETEPVDILQQTADSMTPPSSADASLGDIDLVQAVIDGCDDFRDTAVSLIRQHTNWNCLRLDAADGAGEPVRYGDRVFGVLACTKATANQLRPWATWLATWLAMEESFRSHQHMAYCDELTGAWNRRYFNRFLEQTLKVASVKRRPVTVMVFDIDDFKMYNDAYGHAAGDEILCETVRLLNSVIRQEDRVCRIGGDEFAVVFADIEGPREVGSVHPENVEQIAQRFQDQICTMRFPKLSREAHATLSISAGLATYPWDGADAKALLDHADQLALQSKNRGKNAITLGPGAQQYCRRPLP